MYRVLVFGDSIAYGSWDTKGGWVERLKADAHSRTVASGNTFKRQIFNLGVGGHTSSDILNRMDTEIEARAADRWELALLFMFGTNDERLVDGEPQVSSDGFRQNVTDIIEKARGYTDTIIILGIPPLPLPEIAFKTSIYNDERVKEYDINLKELAQAHSIPYLDVRSEFEKHDLRQLFTIENDPHPNDAGHQVLYELAKSKLEEVLL